MYKQFSFKNMALVAVAAVSAGIMSVPAFADAEVGKTAPDFTLQDSSGKAHELSKLRGKTVVLEWFNEECPFVQKHYKSDNMQKLQKEFTGKGVVWYTINSSADGKPGNHKGPEYDKILNDWKAAPTAFLLDHDGKVGKMYGAKTTPDMFVIDKKGTLVYAGAIDDHASPDQSDIAKSKNYVKEALDEVLEGKQVKVAATKSYGCSVKYAN
ncbi:MAG TPA: thioredoxin family protein [Drouetiella sp.]